MKTQKVLQIRVFQDLLDGFLVTQIQTLLNQQRTEDDSCQLRRRTLCAREVFRVDSFDLIPGDQLSHGGPAILAVEFATEGQDKIFECELVGEMFSVHAGPSRCKVF